MLDATIDAFGQLDAVRQAFVASIFTWGMTALGAGVVFVTRSPGERLLAGSLGFAAGVMAAASFWSLLAPAIALADEMGYVSWVPAAVGFLAGGAALRVADAILPHLHPFASAGEVEGLSTSWRRAILLVLAITLHNVPEGLAVGVAFGAVEAGFGSASFGAAIALAIGIGLQNCPEGTAVAVPLRAEGVSRGKSFWYGQLSAVVEPIAAVLGALAVTAIRPLLPFALAFAAGGMFYVVIEEVIPDAERSGHSDIATVCAMVGFTLMMALDVALSP